MATSSQSKQPLAQGSKAPDFTLLARPGAQAGAPGKTMSLADFAGAPLVMVFYPLDFSPVCSDELAVFNELLPEFKRFNNAKVVGISVDSTYCHQAFARDRHLNLPLLSDFHPKGEVSRAYNAYDEANGFSDRCLYVIDPEGKVFWSHLSPLDVNPGADGVLDALERMTGITPWEEQHEAQQRVQQQAQQREGVTV